MLIHSSKQQRRNLQGRSFKNQDLTNQDFSFADIRGADFTGANLTGANFNYALAGLTKFQVIRIFILVVILSIVAAMAVYVASYIPIKFILNQANQSIPIFISAVLLIVQEIGSIGLLIVTIRQGIQKAIGYLYPVISLMIITIPILPVFGVPEHQVIEWFIFFGGFLSFLGVFVLIYSLSLAVVLAETIAGKLLGNIAVAVAGIVAAIAVGIVTENEVYDIAIKILAENEVDNFKLILIPIIVIVTALAVSLSLTLILIAQHLAKKILAEDKNNLFILKFAVAIGAIKGTCFKNANLTDADFSHAILKSTNFRFANATRTFWRQTKYLKFARVEATILEDIKIRDLLVTGWGKDQEYKEANLRGANLMSADLSNANFKLANLSEASLQAANLNNANLTEVLAIGTNFTNAQMSGTCLEAWNIDHTTILDNVESKCIYLLEEPKPETDDRERRPSSGYFQEGDFTKLFTEVLNTVDLIFRNGVDAKAFMSSFQQVQVENQGIPMKIQGMENKGDGVVVIRIDVPPEIEKEKIHREFMEFYDKNVRVLEEKYQKKLEGIQEQINLNLQESERKYRIELDARSEQQKNYMMSLVDGIFQKSTSANYLVTLNFEGGSFATGFPVIRANIWLDSHPLPISFTGNLTPKLEIYQLYQNWREKYQQLGERYEALNLHPRVKVRKEHTTGSSQINQGIEEIISQIQELEKEWRSLLNNWLNDPNFHKIEKELRTRFNPSDKVRLIIQSEDILIQRIPWHLWNFFSDYKFAETAIGLPEANRVEKFNIARGKIRILAIFGDDKGINIEADKQYLSSLSSEAEIISLVKPSRQKLDEKLWDEKGWDVICFSAHSESKADGSTGFFDLGNETKMTIEELENSLATTIRKGLQLAIFNSCDGLGLARQLAKLHIPAIIVMREEVPDVVAQKFLKYFLELFASGKSLYISVRQARELLQVIEDKFPGASWLPVICQNAAEIPPIWQSLQIFHSNFEGGLTKLLSPLETDKFKRLASMQKNLLQQYYELTNLSELSQHEAEQIEKILERAESDDLLNYWIEKIDGLVYEKLGLFTEEKLDYYEKQRTRGKEFFVD